MRKFFFFLMWKKAEDSQHHPDRLKENINRLENGEQIEMERKDI